jgi:mevalonate kinase
MVAASAPGKVILFGEHAVVYGEPSLAGAISKRVRVEAARAPKGLRIYSDKSRDYRYVEKAVELVFDHIGKSSGLSLRITSELPPASGLGSSAAVSVATIAATARALGCELSKEEISQLGHRTELEVQGAASPTDTLTATLGGILYIQPRKKKYTPVKASLPLVVGYTGIERSTKQLVEQVRALRDEYPEVVLPIIKNIGQITREAKERLEGGDDIGDLMDINHGLLEALGVGNELLSRLVHAARAAGARGAKITGAGGGGCIIAYAPGKTKEVLKAIEAQGCLALEAGIESKGVRLEK